ncbi:MAG: hypothetical protein LBF38_08020 [Deltaproteobacteria bacterium]|jgi:hypothetical protein|nr:hypothetical protein [Deltaproteobacteria bacterium]
MSSFDPNSDGPKDPPHDLSKAPPPEQSQSASQGSPPEQPQSAPQGSPPEQPQSASIVIPQEPTQTSPPGVPPEATQTLPQLPQLGQAPYPPQSQPPGAPPGLPPLGPTQGSAQLSPQGSPLGPPQGPYQGPPQYPPQLPPQGPPPGPYQGAPQYPPQGTPQGAAQGQYLSPPSGPTPAKKSKVKLLIAAVVLVLVFAGLGAGLYYYFYAPKWAEQAFVFVMDTTFGKGHYQYEELNYDIWKKTLVVSKITFRPFGLAEKLGITKIDRIVASKLICQKAFENALSGQAKGETILSEKLIIEGPQFYTLDQLASGYLIPWANYEISLGSIELTNLKYTNEQNLFALFLPKHVKNYNFETIKVIDYFIELRKDDDLFVNFSFSDFTLTLGDYKIPLDNNFDIIQKISSLPIIFLSFSDFNLDAPFVGYSEELSLKYDYLEIKNYYFDKLESFYLKNFDARFNNLPAKDKLMIFFNKLELKDIDFSYLNINSLVDIENILQNKKLPDTPVKGSFELDSLSLMLENRLKLSLKRLALGVKYSFDQGPSNIVSTVEELTFKPYLGYNARRLVEEFSPFLVENFNQTELSYSFSQNTTYDPETGNLTFVGSPCAELAGVIGFDCSFTLTGLSPITVNDIKDFDYEKALFDHPEIKLVDIEVIIKNEKIMPFYMAATGESSNWKDSSKFSNKLPLLLTNFTKNLSEYTAINRNIASSLEKAIRQPGIVSIKGQPTTPVSLLEFLDPKASDLKKLNLNFTVNDEPTIFVN